MQMSAALAVAAVLVSSSALGASAPGGLSDNASPITDHFYLRGDFFAPTVTTNFRVDARNGTLGTPLVAENDLGLDGKIDQGRIEVMFRLHERSKLRFDFFRLQRDGNKLLTRQINFGDDVFNINDRVISQANWDTMGITYTYSFIRRDRFELGAGLGVHLLDAEARGEVRARALRQDASGVGAFPTIALDATWRISKRFALAARGQQFSTTISNFSGSLSDYHAELQYRWRSNFALGLGYSKLRYDLKINSSSFPGFFDLRARGPEFFVRVSF
jgi:hypothetical protein